jgi:hypothetical protein
MRRSQGFGSQGKSYCSHQLISSLVTSLVALVLPTYLFLSVSIVLAFVTAPFSPCPFLPFFLFFTQVLLLEVLFFLYGTGAFLYVPYSFLLISNKFCDLLP